MPGPPAGPSLRMTTTSPASMPPRVTAAIAASSPSNTRAGPAVVAALVAGELDDAALGREVAAQDRQAAGRLDRVVERSDDVLALGLGGVAGVLADRLAGDGDRVLVEQPGLVQALEHDAARRRPRRGRRRRSCPPGLRSHSSGVRSLMRSKSSMSSSTPASRATASRCRTPLVEPPAQATPAIAFSSDAWVMMSLGRRPRLSTSIDELAGLVGDLGLGRVLGGDESLGHRRDAEDLEGHRHRVGGELAAAGAGARARDGLELGELLVGHRARPRARRPPRRRPGS